MDSRFFPKTINAWNGLAFAEAPSLAVFRSHLEKITSHGPFLLYLYGSANIDNQALY